MPQTIEFFYDFRSPYSYLALTELSRLDVQIDLRPMQILTVMEKVGNVPTTITCQAKGIYARTDLARWARRYGLTLNPSDMRKNDGEACSQAVLSAESPDEALSISLLIYKAIWSEGKLLTSANDVIAHLSASGLDGDRIRQSIDNDRTVAALTENTNEAVRRGVFGSPTMFLGDQMYFGNDRIDFLKEELSRLESAQ